MYKVPTDSDNEDDVPIRSYFERRKEIKLDETIRNRGLTATTLQQNSELKLQHTSDIKNTPNTPAPNTNQVEQTSTVTITNLPKTTTNSKATTDPSAAAASSTTNKNNATSAKSLSEAFAFIKSTEFYDEKEVDQILEEKRKRKLEKAPGSGVTDSNDLSSSVLIVSSRQRGNPLLAHIRNVALTYSDTILPDYIMGSATCALFLSLKYHRLHPDYIYERLRQLGTGYTVRVLLLLCDIPDSAVSVQELTKVALLSNCTLLLSWSCVEAARYIESFKIYEHKPVEVLQGIKDTTYQGYLHNFLTSIRGVNKSDTIRLKSEFGTVKNICNTDKDKLSSVPGIGAKKATRIYDIFHTPFKSNVER